MKIFIITPFPEVVDSFMRNSIIKKAQDNNLINYETLDLFEYADKPHRNIDDYPFGGSTGMVMKPEPIFNGITKIKSDNLIDDCPIILMSPQGKILNQEQGKKISKFKDIIVIAGRYEGVDERIVSNLVSDEISIGDYILSGG